MIRLLRKALLIVDRAGPHYLCFVLAGIAGPLFLFPELKDLSFVMTTIWFWLMALLVGGTLCVYGRWTVSMVPKMIGLGLNIVGILTYTVALLGSWPRSAASIFLLLSFASMLSYSFRDVRRTHDALVAVRRGNPTRSDLATYAQYRLARGRYGDRSNLDWPETLGSDQGETSGGEGITNIGRDQPGDRQEGC